MHPLENLLGAAQVGGTLILAPLLRGGYNRWSATPEEIRQPLPGDDMVPQPLLGYTRAITIRARGQRLAYSPDMAWVWRLTEPVGFVMERKMLLGIRQRAERFR